LKVGNEALKKIHEVLNIDEVERILDETREGVEKQRVCIISHLVHFITVAP
jgi:charged multivesicular body protein 6